MIINKWNIFFIFPNYNQKDAKSFIYLFISTDALHVSGGSSPIIRSTKLYIELQVLSTNIAAYCYRGRDGTQFHLVHDSSSIGWQYLKLYVQLCAPDDGRWNRLKHVERL